MSIKPRGITVCVEFTDLLSVSLPSIMPHLSELLVVTAPHDKRTIEMLDSMQVQHYQTDAFYRDGATFNKGLAVEEGLDVLGRRDWMCIFDSDIVWPTGVELPPLAPQCLYTPRRRILADPRDYWKLSGWLHLPVLMEAQFAGYCQIFHADAPQLQRKPWYGVDWRHAGGCDTVFQNKWPRQLKRRLPFEVLHLGEPGVNWMGRVSPYMSGHVPELAAERWMMMQAMRANRGKRGGQPEERLCPSTSPSE